MGFLAVAPTGGSCFGVFVEWFAEAHEDFACFGVFVEWFAEAHEDFDWSFFTDHLPKLRTISPSMNCNGKRRHHASPLCLFIRTIVP